MITISLRLVFADSLQHDFFEMWEIYENGDIPYRGLSNMEVRSYVTHNQRRLELPKVTSV